MDRVRRADRGPALARAPAAPRDAMGARLCALMFREMFELRFVQTDPKLANYLWAGARPPAAARPRLGARLLAPLHRPLGDLITTTISGDLRAAGERGTSSACCAATRPPRHAPPWRCAPAGRRAAARAWARTPATSLLARLVRAFASSASTPAPAARAADQADLPVAARRPATCCARTSARAWTYRSMAHEFARWRRCPWAGTDPLYVPYHDHEWGVPVHDDRQLFEFLMLEGAQAGLSWITILRKREAYRARVRRLRSRDGRALHREASSEAARDPGIVRNRLKVESAVDERARVPRGAEGVRQLRRVPLALRRRQADAEPVPQRSATCRREPRVRRAVARTCKSAASSSSARRSATRYMQATGMVNDHLVELPAPRGRSRSELARIARMSRWRRAAAPGRGSTGSGSRSATSRADFYAVDDVPARAYAGSRKVCFSGVEWNARCTSGCSTSGRAVRSAVSVTSDLRRFALRVDGDPTC